MEGRENGVCLFFSGGVNWPLGGSMIRVAGMVSGLRVGR